VTNVKSSILDAALDAAIERVLRGDRVAEAEVDERELQAARFVANAVPELLPAAATRQRARRTIRERLAAKSEAGISWRLGPITLPAPHFRAVPIAVVLLIGVVVGGAYAIPVFLPQVFGLNDPSAVEILQSGRAQELHLTQTAAGITITADRAYADPHRIVVQFTVQNPPDDPNQPVNSGQKVKSPLTTGPSVTLTDSAGHVYRIVRAVESPLSSGPWNGEPLVGVFSFDGSQIPADVERVSFQLTIAELRGIPPSVCPHCGSAAAMHVSGPWTFAFAIPVSR
jgi:uncharacterized protein DUF4179